MKRIKSFKLFESDGYSDMMESLKDIKSIEYLVEEDGYRINYEFIFRRDDDEVIHTISESDVISDLKKNIPLGHFIGFRIEILYQNDAISRFTGGKPIFTPEQIDKINIDCERYCNLFREHVDYASDVKRLSSINGKNFIFIKL